MQKKERKKERKKNGVKGETKRNKYLLYYNRNKGVN